MFNPKAYTLPKPIATQVELSVREGKLCAFSTNRQAWIQLAENWRIVPESASRPEPFYKWERTVGDETISFSEARWNCLSDDLKSMMINHGFKKVQHYTTVLSMYAYTRQGHPLVNFRYIDHKLYADIVR